MREVLVVGNLVVAVSAQLTSSSLSEDIAVETLIAFLGILALVKLILIILVDELPTILELLKELAKILRDGLATMIPSLSFIVQDRIEKTDNLLGFY